VSAASFVVPTRGRVDTVIGLLRTIQRQSVPVEVLVMDDGGSSELEQALDRDFGAARYLSLGTGRGPAFQRNRGIELASSEIVFAVDDDTLLPSPAIVEQTVRDFSDSRIAAVAIPYINVRKDDTIHHRAPDASAVWLVHAFTGASHAIRRSAFLSVGGYREHYFYMGEEGDLCLRLLDRGQVVRAGTADAIHHLESPLRDSPLADFCGRRNDIYFAWHNVPSTTLAVHLLGTTINGLVSAARAPHPLSSLKGIGRGYVDVLGGSIERQPVRVETYRLQRELKVTGPRRLSDIQSVLQDLVAHPIAGAS
jgi:GT2 family glycosyltransferase